MARLLNKVDEIERLLKALFEGSAEARQSAIATLTNQSERTEPLGKSFGEWLSRERTRMEFVTEALILKLRECGDAMEPLLGFLRAGDVAVRCCVSTVLGKIGDARAIEPLLEVVREKDLALAVRKSALDALGFFRSPPRWSL